MDTKESLWPYVLFLPETLERKGAFIRTVLASKVAAGVLSSFGEDGQVLQRDLIRGLPHSNKSVLAYLKVLKGFNLITTGSRVLNGKRVVYHDLTKAGWGLKRFFSGELPSSDLSELTESLLEDYLSSLVSLYRDRGIESSALFDVFARTRAKAILQDSPVHKSPEIVLFGASAYFTRVQCSETIPIGSEIGCTPPARYPGGPTVDTAVALAEHGQEVALVSSVGNDQDGWNLISNLISRNIDVSHFVVEDDKHTNETIILDEPEGRRTLVGIGKLSALSITTPSQVPWDLVANASVIFIGEVFLEVAVSIAAFAKARGVSVVYRCSPHYWKYGLRDLEPVLKQVDVLLISEQEWQEVKTLVDPNPIPRIQEISDAAIIVKQDGEAYKVFQESESKPIWHVSEYSTQDLSKWFIAGFLKEMLRSSDPVKAFNAGIKLEGKLAKKG